MKTSIKTVLLFILLGCNFHPAEAKQNSYPWDSLPAEEKKDYEAGKYNCPEATETFNYILTFPTLAESQDPESGAWVEIKELNGMGAYVIYLKKEEQRLNAVAIATDGGENTIFLMEYNMLRSYLANPEGGFNYDLVKGKYFCVFPIEDI